ncbi:MAG: pyridoxamine 5'-phosphate oxidase family protein, partial [Vicinamibacterales bacterium]|nr:pyridoxamine 5'-phosphate oxidase family protein [Vicinamibacterales bacterium]
MALSLNSIRACLEGAVPAVIATCARDGTPNVSYISEVHYVDPRHVALSFQFFSKTRQNVLENPRATVVVAHPETGAQYRLAVHYLRTEDSGPLFECMKAKLAGIASHSGMTGVFRLRGADVYRVESVSEVPGTRSPIAPSEPVGLADVRASMARLSGAPDLGALFDGLLDELEQRYGISHAMVLMLDTA